MNNVNALGNDYKIFITKNNEFYTYFGYRKYMQQYFFGSLLYSEHFNSFSRMSSVTQLI